VDVKPEEKKPHQNDKTYIAYYQRTEGTIKDVRGPQPRCSGSYSKDKQALYSLFMDEGAQYSSIKIYEASQSKFTKLIFKFKKSEPLLS